MHFEIVGVGVASTYPALHARVLSPVQTLRPTFRFPSLVKSTPAVLVTTAGLTQIMPVASAVNLHGSAVVHAFAVAPLLQATLVQVSHPPAVYAATLPKPVTVVPVGVVGVQPLNRHKRLWPEAGGGRYTAHTFSTTVTAKLPPAGQVISQLA